MSFTVTYDGNNSNGGSPPDSSKYNTGDKVTVPGNTGNLVKSNDTFARWNTAADGSGTSYGSPAPTTFNMGTSNVVLYAQWYTTSQLTDIGLGPGITQHFQFAYDTALEANNIEPARTNSLLAAASNGIPVCENDYQIMWKWFGSSLTLNSVISVPIQIWVANLDKGANTSSSITLKPGSIINGDADSPANYLRYLYVSEITELFMDAQHQGWFAPNAFNEQSCGEALSRFLAQQFLVETGIGTFWPGYEISPYWLNSSLPAGTPGSNQLSPQATVLTAAINNVVNTIPVQNVLSYPYETTFVIQIDSEQMLVTSTDSSAETMTVTRNYNGTTAAAHANNASVYFNYGSRADYVNTTLEFDNGIDPATGCGMLFLYYLNRGQWLPDEGIAAAPGASQAASCLRGVYNNLTQDPGDPFPFFKSLLDAAFPPDIHTDIIPGSNPDNPWPLGSLTFWSVKDTWGKDEVNDIVTKGGGVYPGTGFWLMLEGFNKQVTGSATPSQPVITFTDMQCSFDSSSGILYETTNQYVPQRIRYPYDISFTSASVNAFPTVAQGEISEPGTSNMSILGTSIPALGEFFFVPGANPYFTNVMATPNPSDENNPHLSADLRVFTATPNRNLTPVPTGPTFKTIDTAGAYGYITSLIPWLNKHFGDPNGLDPFDSSNNVIPAQASALNSDSSVTPFTKIGKKDYINYNFAVARVRLRGAKGPTGAALGVKVFFRLWGTQSADTDWNPSYTYKSQVDSAGDPEYPQAPLDNHTIPFFATENPDLGSISSPEFGTNGVNNQTITIMQGDTQWAYFGCFLDLYNTNLIVNGQHVTKLFPGDHHCLVAQIAYDGAPIKQIGNVPVTTANSTQLAQRNLQVTPAANPGSLASQSIPQTFDVRLSTATEAQAANQVDELMIDWGNTPVGSTAQIYWPQLPAATVIQLASTIYSTHELSAADPYTIQCTTGASATYIPLPFGDGSPLAGLFTINPPPFTVKKGQQFNILVQRFTWRAFNQRLAEPALQIQRRLLANAVRYPPRNPNRTAISTPAFPQQPLPRYERNYIGSFGIQIPVSKAAALLPAEEVTLSILKARLGAMDPSNIWRPVLQRYVGYIMSRVSGFGGDPSSIPPSFTGGVPSTNPNPPVWYPGKVCGLEFGEFGEFEGFILRVERGKERGHEVTFQSHDRKIEEIVDRAWREEALIDIFSEEEEPRHVYKIVFRGPLGTI